MELHPQPGVRLILPESELPVTLTIDPPITVAERQQEPAHPKPPLKWAGGKRWLVPYLRPLWEPYRNHRYVEPFCGGMASPLGLRPRRAWLNDNNIHLIGFYHQLQDGLQVEIPLENDRALYYQYREWFNQHVRDGRAHEKTASELFYYLNRTCYNGLCRFNRKGEFNVPFGSYKRINYLRDFEMYREVMRPWRFTNGDFESMILDRYDFVYADPPYDVPFVQYSQFGFSWDDQVRLAKWLARHPGPTIISNQATDRIMALYQELGFELRCLPAPRRISCNGSRTPAIEVLATRNL
jgi:DNA adenine methylase